MTTSLKMNLVWAGICSLILLIVSSVGLSLTSVSAQVALPEVGEETTTTEVEAEVEGQESFVHRAQAGDNLTLLIRRSIQLHLAAQETDLSVGRLIAAETCAVQEAGSYQLQVDQQVSLSSDLIETCVIDAQELEAAAETRWAAYAPINQELEHIQPIAVPSYIQLVQEVVDASDDNQPPVSQSDSSQTTKDSGRWAWWLVGILAAVVVFRMFGGNEISKRYQDLQKNKKSKK